MDEKKRIPATLEARLEYYYPIFRGIVEDVWAGVPEKEGTDYDKLTKLFLAQAIVESSLDAEAVGRFVSVDGARERAIGIMQILPSTFQFISRQINPDCENIYNVEDNIRAGVSYARWLYDRLRKVMPRLPFRQLMEWVFAEYNWRLGLWEKFGKIEQPLPMNELPDETYNYIAKIEEWYLDIEDMPLE